MDSSKFAIDAMILLGYGRKCKIAKVRLSDGSVHGAEIHWYEVSKIGRKKLKIKRFL